MKVGWDAVIVIKIDRSEDSLLARRYGLLKLRYCTAGVSKLLRTMLKKYTADQP